MQFFTPVLVAGLAAALNLEWEHQGQRYWATEVTRFSSCNETAHLLSNYINDDGIGYFTVGGVVADWPQFACPDIALNISQLQLPVVSEAGAYVVSSMKKQFVVSRVYQVQPDPAIAFMGGATSAITDANDDEDVVFATFPGGGIPIPAATSGHGLLSGLRFAVKDIYHVRGLTTTGGSRAYGQVYGAQNYTNAVVSTSLRAGAQLVGKTKTIAFALGTPRNGWEVDYQDPWNFRGDGYQTTGGSSSGSGAAVTAYDWLDFAIGSDTGGSVRFPARFAGLFGYKPTHGVFNLTGILVAIAEQDTPGHLARSPDVFVRVYRAWAAGTTLEAEVNQYAQFPTKMQYWMDEAVLSQPAAQDMVVSFFARMQTALNMTSVKTNVTASWNAHVTNQSMTTYLQTTYQDQNSAQTWDRIGKPLSEAYAMQSGFEGAFPPADPVVNMTWADGMNATTRARYDQAMAKRVQFADWFNTHIVPRSNGTCTDSIVAHTLHVAPSTVKYDQTAFGLVRGWYNGLQASFAGTPEIVVPIGQVQYHSPFTRRLEWQAVTVAFMAARECDGVLFDLVEKLADLGLVTEVKAGKLAFSV
jgi:Asp-tRNA(Asn)/Glu-tRNA(Gln) amidotransferase A subunit family amidase